MISGQTELNSACSAETDHIPARYVSYFMKDGTSVYRLSVTRVFHHFQEQRTSTWPKGSFKGIDRYLIQQEVGRLLREFDLTTAFDRTIWRAHASALWASFVLQASARAACSVDLLASYSAASRCRSDSRNLRRIIQAGAKVFLLSSTRYTQPTAHSRFCAKSVLIHH